MKEFFDSELFDDIRRILDKITEKYNGIREPGRPLIIKGFIAIILLLSTLSVSMMVLESIQSKPQETTVDVMAEESTTGAEQLTMPERGQLRSNILFALDNDQGDIHLLAVMSVDSETQESKVLFLDPKAVCKVNEIEESLVYHLKNGGASQLVLAVREYTGLDIERYLVGDEKAFVSLVKYLGDVEVDVKHGISYNHDGLSYIIDKGVQVMTPDMLLKYLVYLTSNTEKYSESIRSLLSLFAKMLFDCESSQQAQDNFGKVIGFFETNISALDFSENKAAVIKLAHELTLRLKAYNSLAEFNGFVPQEQ